MTRNRENGFTLIELVLTIAILGIIMIPLTGFLMSYFDNSAQVQDRLADSHDIQIMAAYFSEDVANTSSVSVDGSPPPCAPGLENSVLLLKWQSWAFDSANETGEFTNHSAAYVAENGALHRVTCTGSTIDADIVVVHNYESATPGCPSPTDCTSATPTTINLNVHIQAGSGDTTGNDFTFTGTPRQSA